MSEKGLRAFRRLAGVSILLALWELNARTGFYSTLWPDLNRSFFPPLSVLAVTFFKRVLSAEYAGLVGLTLGRTLSAFSVSSAIGALLGLFAARSRMFADFVSWPAEFLRQLPAVALLPFAIVLFGLGSFMKVFLAVAAATPIVFVATKAGLASVTPRLALTARLYEWSSSRVLFGVMLPSALPSIIAGMRLAMAISLILIVMAEMLVGGDGIGGSLVQSERTFSYSTMYAETLALGLIGIVLNGMLELIASHTSSWQKPSDWQAR